MQFIDSFFSILKKSVVAMMFVIFGFVATYVPQPINHIETVEAGAVVYDPTNWIQNSLTAVATTATSIATASLWVKENVLDAIAWVLAKGIISSMVSSLINWVNTGFGGSPGFVQDLREYLRVTAVSAQTDFISNNILGGGSFICNITGINLQAVVAQAAQLQTDLDMFDLPTASCNLGPFTNIDAFVTGNFSAGGWDDWFDLVQKPEVAPYSQILAGVEGTRREILNAQFEESEHIRNANGLLSTRNCSSQPWGSGARTVCAVTTPGKIIQEALSFNIDSGRQSLVAADELNEIIVSLLSNLANQAFSGASGLLGLTSGGYTGSLAGGGGAPTPGSALSTLTNAQTLLNNYQSLATSYRSTLNTIAATSPTSSIQTSAQNAVNNINNVILPKISADLAQINTWIANWSTYTPTQQSQIISQFSALNVYTQANVSASQTQWDAIIAAHNNTLPPPPPTP